MKFSKHPPETPTVPEARLVREGGRSPRWFSAGSLRASPDKRAQVAKRNAHTREQLRELAAVAVGMAPLLVVVGLGMLMMWSAAMAGSP